MTVLKLDKPINLCFDIKILFLLNLVRNIYLLLSEIEMKRKGISPINMKVSNENDENNKYRDINSNK